MLMLIIVLQTSTDYTFANSTLFCISVHCLADELHSLHTSDQTVVGCKHLQLMPCRQLDQAVNRCCADASSVSNVCTNSMLFVEHMRCLAHAPCAHTQYLTASLLSMCHGPGAQQVDMHILVLMRAQPASKDDAFAKSVLFMKYVRCMAQPDLKLS